MPEKPPIPPYRKPVSEFPTPSPAVVIYTELVNRDDPAYYQNAPVKRGSLYSSMSGANQTVLSQYPNLYFLRERKFGQSDQLVLWDWATEPFGEDAYNYEEENVANAVGFPAFTRVYTIRRDVYDDSDNLAIGSTLTALIGVTITSGGEGYTKAKGKIDGTDVDIDFVVSYGAIIGAVINNEGTGVTASSAIDIIGDGINAQAIPIVQPTNCYLTSQKKQEFPEDHPLRNEFVRVTRTYETLPGPFIDTTRIDDDGKVVTIRTRRNIAANIVSSEAIQLGFWGKVTKKGDDDFVADEVIETRAVPGNPMVTTRIDTDGVVVTVTRILGDTTTIVSNETIGGGNWIRTFKEAVSDLVANQVQEVRAIPGNDILETQINKDGDITSVTRTLVEASTIATTNSIVGGVWTKTYEVPLNGSDLVATKTVEVRNTQYDLPFYSIEIPDLVPQEFRAFIPTTTTETTEIGTASAPTLGVGDLSRSERQLDVYSFRRTITGRAGVTLPITHTNKELTEQYGGGVLNVIGTLEDQGSGTIDQGLTVVSSSIVDLGNGMEFKQTRQLDGADWPILVSEKFDEEMQVMSFIETQVVDPSYVVTSGTYFVETLEEIDTWRSRRVKLTRTPTAVDVGTALTTYKYHPFRFPGLLTTTAFGYYVRASNSELCRHTIRTWWQSNVGTPSISVDEIIMDDPIISTLNNTSTLAYAGPCLHNAFTSFGVLVWAATTPTYTQYTSTWIGNEKIIAATVQETNIPNLWKIETISVVMR